MEPTVTAVIPCYNYAHLLPRAAESALSQTYPLHEVIVVDDGSTDNTREVASAYGGKVKYVYQKNQGVSSARNHGVRIASGEWIAFLDADDWWAPNKTERQIASLAGRKGAILSYCGMRSIFDPGDRVEESPALEAEALWPRLRFANCIALSSAIVSRRALLDTGGFNETLKAASCEDWDMWLRLFPRGEFVAVNEPLLNYWVAQSSGSANTQRMLHNLGQIIETSHLAGLAGLSRWRWRRKIWAAELFRCGITSREWNRAGEAAQYMLRSVISWPSPAFLHRRYRALALTAWKWMAGGK